MVYRLKTNRNQFLMFDVSPDEWLEKLGEDYIFMLDDPQWTSFWPSINGVFFNQSEVSGELPAVPDVSVWFMENLVLSDKAYNVLKLDGPESVLQAGEFLPVSCEGVKYWVWHITSFVDDSAVDDQLSVREVEPSGHIEVSNLTFKAGAEFTSPVFHTSYDGGKGLYCTQGFKDWIEAVGFAGLVFDTDLANIF